MNLRKPLLRFWETSLKGNRIYANLDLLRAFYALPLPMQLQIQEERLSALLQHAAKNVPYYADKLNQAGAVSRRGEVDVNLFTKIPHLTKAILRRNFEDLKSGDWTTRRVTQKATGGTTGELSSFLHDGEHRDLGLATMLYEAERIGTQPGQPYVQLWAVPGSFLAGGVDLKGRVANFLRNRTLLMSSVLTEHDMLKYVSIIQRRRPLHILAYAESIYQLAQFIKKRGLILPPINAIITSVSTLQPFMREEIESTFNCKVYNRYGCQEADVIATEDGTRSGLQVFRYTQFVEIVNEAGELCKAGEEGEVLVTSLSNYAMPLIRYRIGDRAVPEKIDGILLKSVHSIRELSGRVSETLIKRDGSLVAMNFFLYLIRTSYEKGWITKGQVVQEDFETIVFKAVAEPRPPEAALQELRAAIQKAMGPDCNVRFEFVSDIPPAPSGKYLYSISKLQLPRRDIS